VRETTTSVSWFQTESFTLREAVEFVYQLEVANGTLWRERNCDIGFLTLWQKESLEEKL
jgi:hypothetical protein